MILKFQIIETYILIIYAAADILHSTLMFPMYVDSNVCQLRQSLHKDWRSLESYPLIPPGLELKSIYELRIV